MTAELTEPGVPGEGPPGPPGPQGPPGEGADVAYVFDQNTPSALWLVGHNLGKHPSVTVVDSAGSTVEGAVDYVDDDNLTISFASAFSGSAYLN